LSIDTRAGIIVSLCTLVYVAYVISWYYGETKTEREPISSVIDAILLGFASVGVTFFIKAFVLLFSSDYFIQVILLSPLAEEISKDIFVYYLIRQPECDEYYDAILYGSFVGAGFAFVENIIYGLIFSQYDTFLGIFIVILRVSFFPIGHTLFSGIFGLMAYKKNMLIGFFVGYVMHALWNFIAVAPFIYSREYFFGLIYFLYVLILYLMIRSAIKQKKQRNL